MCFREKCTRLALRVNDEEAMRLIIILGAVTVEKIEDKIKQKLGLLDPIIQVKYRNNHLLLDEDVASLMNSQEDWEIYAK